MPLRPLQFKITHLDEIDSTNLYAIQQIHAGLAMHGAVYDTSNQTAGKGQRGKLWQAQMGENITLSVVLGISPLAISQVFRLSVTIALASSDFLMAFYPNNIFIKWPNDIFINDRKAGGILIENVLNAGIWQWSVAGIGLNINQLQFDPSLKLATSLAQATQQQYDLPALKLQLLECINKRWKQLSDGYWPQLLADYNHRLYGSGKIHKLKKDNAVIPCKISRVNEQGVLLAGESEEWQFEFGEITWIL